MANLCTDHSPLRLKAMTQMQEETEGHAQLHYLSQVSKEKTLKKCDRHFVFQAQWGEKRKKKNRLEGWKRRKQNQF